MEKPNYNRTHIPKGWSISGTVQPITVGDLRDAIASYPDETEIAWGVCTCGTPQVFYRFKDRGHDMRGNPILQIETTGQS
jgi:hypothetical protein